MSPQVLVVDDEPRLLHIVGMFLELEGFHVTCAGGGEEALELLRHRRFNAAIIDVMMPGCDGLEVCRRLRREAVVPGMPVIVFTSLSGDADIEAARAAGATHFISKPFSLPGLGGVISQLLSQRPAELTA